MRFTVTWTQGAIDTLAAVWALAEDRQAIADAADKIDRLLKKDGDRVGRQLFHQYFLESGPIAVVFDRRIEDRIIKVTDLLVAKQEES